VRRRRAPTGACLAAARHAPVLAATSFSWWRPAPRSAWLHPPRALRRAQCCHSCGTCQRSGPVSETRASAICVRWPAQPPSPGQSSTGAVEVDARVQRSTAHSTRFVERRLGADRAHVLCCWRGWPSGHGRRSPESRGGRSDPDRRDAWPGRSSEQRTTWPGWCGRPRSWPRAARCWPCLTWRMKGSARACRTRASASCCATARGRLWWSTRRATP